jgi:Rps23 Pro-64 3,4-dihydroxylase Tpa1-like proline 4-hydroxylase
MMFVRSRPAAEPAEPVEAWAFDRAAMVALGRAQRTAFAGARPYPFLVVDGLLGEARSEAIARAMPAPSHPAWRRRDHAEQAGRLGQLQRTAFEDVAPAVRWMLAELNGIAFLDFLGALTGRSDLIGDPHYTGAGPLVTLPGGHLAVHADFNRDSRRHLDRVVSVLYYAPLTWDAAWGGELELWDRGRTRCEVKILPLRDRLVVMAYGEDHWHGHPEPVRCPDGSARVAIAAYYYAARAAPGDDDEAHGARWA